MQGDVVSPVRILSTPEEVLAWAMTGCCFVAGILTIVCRSFFQKIGRKGVMITGGVCFLIGAALQVRTEIDWCSKLEVV